MLKHPNAVLKLSVALAILLAGAGIGFYFGIFLPAQELRRQTQEMADKKAALQAKERASAERAKFYAAAQTEYQSCIRFAELSYKRRWTQSCQNLHDADQAEFEDCADDLFSTRGGCLAKNPVRPARDCALPASMARQLSDARDGRKTECRARLEAVQQSGIDNQD